jgi:hypothetical protein
MLAMLVGAAFLWFWFRRPFRTRAVLIAAGVAAGMFLFVISPAGHLLRSRFRWYEEDARGGARLLLFRDSLTLASQHLFTGTGLETFSAEFPKVQSVELSRAYPDFYHESPHNILLDALTAQGVLGLIGLCRFHCTRIPCGPGKARKTDPPLAGILGACLAAGLAAHQFTVFTVPTALFFYLVVAMLVALAAPVAEEVRRSRVIMFAALPISALLIVFSARLIIADRELEQINRNLFFEDPSSAIIRYSRVRDLGMYADIWYSNQMAAQALKAPDIIQKLTAWQQALESGNRAAITADDPHNAWYQLSSLYARENQFELTERALRNAIASSPNWFKPHWTLAQVLMRRGRREEAEAEAKLAVDLNGGKNPEVARTLGQIQAKNK